MSPGLPLKLGRCSNGEFVPPPVSPVAEEAMRRAREISDDNARRLGWSRRRFLTSAAGMAAGLVALQRATMKSAAATEHDATRPRRRPARRHPDDGTRCVDNDTRCGGTLTVPPEATLDTELATTTTHVPAGTLLVDVQNHLLDYVMHPDGADFTGFPQAACGEDDPRMCFSPEHWADLVFQQSDTTMAVLSAIPVVGAVSPLSIDAMEHGKEVAAALCGDGRVLIQGHAVPNVGPVEAALDSMSAVAAEHAICEWKVYTHAGPGWYLDDHDPSVQQVGERFLATSSRSASTSSPSTRASPAGRPSHHRSTSALPPPTTRTSRSSSTTPATRTRIARSSRIRTVAAPTA